MLFNLGFTTPQHVIDEVLAIMLTLTGTNLFAYMLFVLVAGIVISSLSQQIIVESGEKENSTYMNYLRKLFHVLCLALLLPGMILYPKFMILAFNFFLPSMILLEIGRLYLVG